MAEVVLVPDDMSETEIEHMFYAADIEVKRIPRQTLDAILYFLAHPETGITLVGRAEQ